MIKIQSIQSNILHSFMEHMIMIQHGQKHQTLSLGMNFCHMRQFQMLSLEEQIVLVHFACRPNIIGLCAKTKLWQADTGVAFTDSPSFSWPDSTVASPDGNCAELKASASAAHIHLSVLSQVLLFIFIYQWKYLKVLEIVLVIINYR